jgi:hypothetical protein
MNDAFVTELHQDHGQNAGAHWLVSWTGNIKDNPGLERFEIRPLRRSGFDVRKLSIAGKGYQVG